MIPPRFAQLLFLGQITFIVYLPLQGGPSTLGIAVRFSGTLEYSISHILLKVARIVSTGGLFSGLFLFIKLLAHAGMITTSSSKK